MYKDCLYYKKSSIKVDEGTDCFTGRDCYSYLEYDGCSKGLLKQCKMDDNCGYIECEIFIEKLNKPYVFSHWNIENEICYYCIKDATKKIIGYISIGSKFYQNQTNSENTAYAYGKDFALTHHNRYKEIREQLDFYCKMGLLPANKFNFVY